jgi:hypothetical protein
MWSLCIIAVADKSFSAVLLSFSFCLDPTLLGMYESGGELLHPEEIQRRFKKVFSREMTRTERDVFFLPVEPPLEQEDNH